MLPARGSIDHLKFVHVPKTGGTSIEDYMKEIHGVNWGRFDPDILRIARSTHKISPWHLPPEFIQWPPGASLFCVVRNPRERIVSEYRSCTDPAWQTPRHFDRWLSEEIRRTIEKPWRRDGHWIPQWEYASRCTHVLRFESLAFELGCLLEVYGSSISKFHFPKKNSSHGAFTSLDMSKKSRNLIGEFYAKDFDKFGYEK